MAHPIPDRPDDRRELALSLLPKPGALIGERWRYQLGDGEALQIDPATGETVATFPLADSEDVDDAVAAATAGLATWSATSARDRSDGLRSIAAALRTHADELALLTSLEVGVPFESARARMRTVPSDWFDYYAGWCDKLSGETIPSVVPGQFSYTIHEPAGVIAKLVTWNSPVGGIQMSAAAALAAGCSMIIRPSELAPFTVMRFGELCREAGLPAGVINILPAGPSGAEALVRHPGIAKVSFTGGPNAARQIQRAAADSLTPLLMELGGKSANIVFPDADLTRAIGHAASVAALSGQGCTLPTRLLVHEKIHDTVVEGVVAALGHIKLGSPFDPSTTMGPVISEDSMERILGMIDRAASAGARIRLGGRRAEGATITGYFVEPTVLVDVDPSSEIAQQEVFGPVLSVIRFRDEDEAMRIANGTSYGLAAYVHTNDLSCALRVSSRLVAGNVCINGAGAPAGYHAPFGGVKDSGYGKEGGREGVLEFVTTKTVTMTI
jgi:aldehyde dehydrogenase (NAD+)